MSEHKRRAGLRAENTKPINFTCGKCKRAVPYTKGYKCAFCDVPDEDEEEEEEVE